MPLYEYRCQKCGNIFEVMQKFADSPLEVHMDCGGQVERLISAPALQFKGTGWYITDYAKSGSNLPKSNGGNNSKDEGGGKSDKADTKKASDSGSSSNSTKSSDSSSSSSSSPSSSSGSTSSGGGSSGGGDSKS